MSLVIIFLVFVLALAGGEVHHRWQRARMANPPPLPRRLPAPHLYRVATTQVLVVIVLALTFGPGGWTLTSVGVHDSGRWLDSMLAGEFSFFGLILVYGLGIRALGLIMPMRAAANHGNLRVWPRGRKQKWIARFTFMVLNPFTEELVMRGILIHQWGLWLGSPVLPIMVGFALNATLHWYQGARMQLWHALFFAMVVSLLYSPWGLLAAITAHWFADVFPLVQLRRSLKRSRAERKASLRPVSTA